MLRVLLKSALLTLGIVAFSHVVSLVVRTVLGLGYDGYSLALNTAVPMIAAFPFAVFICHQEARIRDLYARLKTAHETLTREATRDDLTGLLTRVPFFDEMAAARTNKRRGALLIVDADHFKGINDRYGHLVGDRALMLLASSVACAVRERDVVGRIGGEEFAVYLPQTELADAMDIAERIRSSVGAIQFEPVPGAAHPLSVSIGIARADHTRSRSVLFAEADARLYEAKQKGRDRVVCEDIEPPSAKVTFLHDRRARRT